MHCFTDNKVTFRNSSFLKGTHVKNFLFQMFTKGKTSFRSRVYFTVIGPNYVDLHTL